MVSLLKDLNTGEMRVEFELDETELYAIGRVTVHWAYLEHSIQGASQALADAAGMDLPTDATNLSFTRRLRAFRLLVEKLVAEPHRDRLLRLVSRIANAEAERHKVTHGLWVWDLENPEKINAWSYRYGREFDQAFSADKLHTLANKIGSISADLEFPDGFASVFRSLANQDGQVSFSHISRELAREVKASKDQGSYPPAKPQEGKPPQSSSEA